MYNHLCTTVDNWLAEHCLIYHKTLPLTILVKLVVKEVETKIKDSPLDYRFQPLRSAFADHESLPPKLLGVAGRGIARPNGLIVLCPKSFSAVTTLLDLVSNKTVFAASSCLDNKTNRWMMYLGEIIFDVFLIQFFEQVPL